MKVFKFFAYITLGILFGIVMTKSEAISWFRIQEMFRFQSFHMYGIIGTAVAFGVLAVQVIKRSEAKDIQGKPIQFNDKEKSVARYLLGGTFFGIGWAMTGACPGPIFVNFGYGYTVMIVVIIGAFLGTLVYGVLKERLPH
jgi:uncharacterized membrane protein YedE/YeeE